MSQQKQISVIGAGIVGVSAGIWLRRNGNAVTLVDKSPPGEGTSMATREYWRLVLLRRLQRPV